MRSYCGSHFPSCPLHPDLGLTSSVTGVSGLDSCRPGWEGGGAAAALPRPSVPAPLPLSSGQAVLAGRGLPFYDQALVTMGVTCCFF